MDTTLKDLIVNTVVQILAPLSTLGFTLALLLFFWGVVKYMQAGDSENGRINGRKFMFWAVIALFVSASVWGLVRFVQVSFPGLDASSPPSIWRVSPAP